METPCGDEQNKAPSVKTLAKAKGFTLIELMIVVGVVGILAVLIMNKMGTVIRKSKEAELLGNLGTLRSALNIYYSDTEGQYPRGPAGTNTTFVQAVLQGTYLRAPWPTSEAYPHHPETRTVDTLADGNPPGDDGEWNYVSNELDPDWGKIMVECTHTNLKGEPWSSK
jgi:prepilin-type N-terminal cleavage/methylation domain-containing protein